MGLGTHQEHSLIWAGIFFFLLDRPIVQGYLDGCQHNLQILLRLRPYPVRQHRFLFLVLGFTGFLGSNLTPHW